MRHKIHPYNPPFPNTESVLNDCLQAENGLILITIEIKATSAEGARSTSAATDFEVVLR